MKEYAGFEETNMPIEDDNLFTEGFSKNFSNCTTTTGETYTSVDHIYKEYIESNKFSLVHNTSDLRDTGIQTIAEVKVPANITSNYINEVHDTVSTLETLHIKEEKIGNSIHPKSKKKVFT